ncbi:hypothetical protein DFH28DRAFT_1088354 [Melampsora americana]|nr:hypothetical protein DFH28DRAFT_1088354 [Melampsora americana]
MPSSSRTTQFELWHEIVSKCHQGPGNKLVDQHLDFIRKRFDELDSEGFIWSKESILAIFLQLPLSESPYNAYSSVSRLSGSRVCQGIEKSLDKVKQVIQDEELQDEFRPTGLMDLPIEVFDKILEQLDWIASLKAEETWGKKNLGKVIIKGPGHRKPYTTYLHRNSPILNDLQTFSLTSREIYKLCEPWMWRRLYFPTSLPAPMDLWTDDILLRRGSHVRSLSINLSDNCTKSPGEFVYDPFYDNLIPESRIHSEYISPKNVRNLIHRCPNLSMLEFRYHVEEQDEDKGGTEAFFVDLLPLLSTLKKLQHLALESQTTRMRELPSKVVANLPLLESLMLRVASPEAQHKTGDSSIGFNLSKHKHLSRLEIWYNKDIDESWCLYDWSRTIRHLEIHNCRDLLPSSALRIIQHISPYLTNLKLCYFCEPDGTWGLDPSWNLHTFISLPFLSHLELCSGNPNLLVSFQDCRSLCCLDWTYWTSEHCRSLYRILTEASWPHLKKMDVRGCPDPRFYPRDPELVEDQLLSLQKYCQEVDIEATIWRSYDS